jgi:hypothetical protein
MITKEDLKLEIEQLDDSYLDLVFRLLQQFPHQQKTKQLNDSLSIDYPKTEVDNRFALTAIEDSTVRDKPNNQTKAAMQDVRTKKNLENITLEQLQQDCNVQ